MKGGVYRMLTIYGQMQEVKIVKDHRTHLTTFYY